MSTYTSAFGQNPITVDAMVESPTMLPDMIYENLDGAFFEKAIFRDGGPNNGIVGFNEAAAPFLNDDAEDVAEFGEIPVSAMEKGKQHALVGVKTALAVRISREMRKFNRVRDVDDQINALQNTMVRTSVNASLDAFKNADIQTLGVKAAWDDAKANPLKDLRAAKRMIRNAAAPNREDALMGYNPDTLIISESMLEAAIDHENTQKFYIGNAALENPIYLGIKPSILTDLRVVTSPWLREDEVYVLQSGRAGFVSYSDVLTVTDMYSPGGENGYGGVNQSWRVDAFYNRVIGIDNPKSVVKLEGVAA